MFGKLDYDDFSLYKVVKNGRKNKSAVKCVETMENLLIYWQRGNITPSYFCKYRFLFLSLSLKSDCFGFQIDSCVLFCMDQGRGVSAVALDNFCGL